MLKKRNYIVLLLMLNANSRINCSVDGIKSMWHAFDLTRQLLPAHVTHAAGGILSDFLTRCFKSYWKCEYGAFAHTPVSDCVRLRHALCLVTRATTTGCIY